MTSVMVYTDSNFLMADTELELHRVARSLAIPEELFFSTPFPFYPMHLLSRQLAFRHHVVEMSFGEMIYYYYRHKNQDLLPGQGPAY